MGELSLRWPSRHGFPRSHRGKSHHPQGSRQVLSCTRPQRRRTAGIKDQESFPSIDSNAQLLTCIPQSVTTTPAHTQPPKWTTFSPPPTTTGERKLGASYHRSSAIIMARDRRLNREFLSARGGKKQRADRHAVSTCILSCRLMSIIDSNVILGIDSPLYCRKSKTLWARHIRAPRFLFNLHSREKSDIALKGPCDQARFFRFLKEADSPITILFFPEGDGRPQSNLCKAPTAILLGERTFRGQSQRIKFQT